MPELLGAFNDAMEMSDMFVKFEFAVRILCNEDATKENILRELDNLRNDLDSESLLVIYFAGHGHEEKQDQLNSYHLCPYDFNPNKLTQTSINLLNLRNELSSFQSKHILLLLDCCFSGVVIVPNQINPPQECLLVNYRLQGIWAIVAGMKVREKQIKEKVRGIFTYYLQKTLKYLLSDEGQVYLRDKERDPERETVTLTTAREIMEWMRRVMFNEGMEDWMPNYGVLISPDNIENIGIPWIPNSKEDLEIFTTLKRANVSKQLKEWLMEKQQLGMIARNDLMKRTASLLESFKSANLFTGLCFSKNYVSWSDFFLSCGIPQDRAKSYQAKMVEEEFDLKDWRFLPEALQLIDFIKKGDLLKIIHFCKEN